jgi:hypothetical protein
MDGDLLSDHSQPNIRIVPLCQGWSKAHPFAGSKMNPWESGENVEI